MEKLKVNFVDGQPFLAVHINSTNAAVNALIDLVESGNIYVSLAGLAGNLESWESQSALTVANQMVQSIRTTAGDDAIKTDEGEKIVSIVPKSDFTAKKFFEGCYNLLKHTTLGESHLGGALTGGYYFLVPKLTFGSFGTAEENNGVLFTNSDGENLKPTVRFKALSSGVPTSVNDGSACSYHDEEGYRFYTTDGAGWLIVSGIDRASVCAHIAWEDWYDKYVSVGEAETNPEAQVGILELEAFFALIHSDKILRVIDSTVHDYVEFGDTSAKGYHVVDAASVVAYNGSGSLKWTDTQNETAEGSDPSYTHSVNLASMKANGAAKILGGVTLNVDGNIVSYVDSNAHASAATVLYERATVEVIERAYTHSVFSGSNIDTATGKMPVNDCSIEAYVGMSGEAETTIAYAQNISDALAEIARRRMEDAEDALADAQQDIEELESEVRALHAHEGMACGQPLDLYGHGTPTEAHIPDNWIQLADGGYNWNGKPSALGQTYYDVDNQTGTGSVWKAYKKSDYTLDWMPMN